MCNISFYAQGKELYKFMVISLRKIGDFCIIDLPPDIFSKEKTAELKNSIDKIIDQEFKHILLNMTKISRIDGHGLGILINFQKIAFHNNVSIRIYDLQPYVAEMLYQTRLNRVLDICQAEDENLCEEALRNDVLIA